MRAVFIHSALCGIMAISLQGFGAGQLSIPPVSKDYRGLSGIPLIHNYTTDDFGRYVQHWSVLQLTGSEMALGVSGGLNIYDGNHFHLYRPSGDFVWSMDEGRDGKLYIGGLNELGYVMNDSSGTITYHSLKPHLPDEYHDFTRVWETISYGNFIYFRSPEYMFRWDGENMTVWEPEYQFNFFAPVHDRLLIWQRNGGMYELTDGSITLVPGGEKFADHNIRVLLPYDDKRILIGTRSDGFYIFDGMSFERWETDAEQYITDNVLYRGTTLPDGSFVFATLLGGIVITETNGIIRNIFDKESGLQDQSVLYPYVDSCGVLWLAMQNGLSRIEPMLPVTQFDDRNGLHDVVMSFQEYRERIYAGTRGGIYILDPRNKTPHGYGKFMKLPGINVETRSFTIVENDLLAATDAGIHKINDDSAALLLPERFIFMLSSRFHDGIVYAAGTNSIFLCRYLNGRFTILSETGRIPQPINLAEGDDGSLYVGTRTEGVYKIQWEIQLSPEGNNNSVAQTTTKIGVPAHWDQPDETRVLNFSGRIRVGAWDGLYSVADDYSGLLPDSSFSDRFAGGEGREIYITAENQRGEVIFSSSGNKFIARPDGRGKYTVNQELFSRINIPQFSMPSALYIDSFDNVWIGGSDTIYRYDFNSPFNSNRNLKARISEVLVNTDSLVYRGALQSENSQNALLLPFSKNDLRFRFFIPAYEDVRSNNYQTKLEPMDEDWSRWTRESFKDYTNLREGRYRFRVRGRDVYGNVSEAAVFEFRVLPPWYRTWWSYGMAGLILTLFLLTIHKYRVYRILEVERTRTRIARDLHDDIGSSLSSIALMIDMFSSKETIPDEDKSELSNIGGTARDMVDSLRDVVWVINPEHDNLATLVERMKSTAGNMLYNIDFTFDTDIAGIHESVGMDFKRSVLLIYKEALNNIIKHSSAKSVSIDIRESDGVFRMRIADDGIGFDESQSADGNGLQNMRYRAQQIHGGLFIESTPGGGTIIELKAELM